jgi:hypothetical protein
MSFPVMLFSATATVIMLIAIFGYLSSITSNQKIIIQTLRQIRDKS